MILIADESKKIRTRLIELINNESGLEVTVEAKDGKEALEMLETYEPNVIILELHLPDMNGIEVLKKSRKNFPETKVIILTNLVSNVYRKIAEESGCYSFYDKSYQFEKVIEDLIKIKDDEEKQIEVC